MAAVYSLAEKLGFAVQGALTETTGREPVRRCRYYEDEGGNLFILRRGILTIIGADGRVY